MKIQIQFDIEEINNSLEILKPLFLETVAPGVFVEDWYDTLYQQAWDNFDDLIKHFFENELKPKNYEYFDEHIYYAEVDDDFDINEYFEFPYNYTIEKLEE